MANIGKLGPLNITNCGKFMGVALGTLAKIGPLSVALGLEAGVKCWFYANVAPSGWTVVSGVADCLLALKGGSQAYNVSGGNLAGTWNQPDHTLTADEIPAHTHGEAGAHGHSAYYGYGLGVSYSRNSDCVMASEPSNGSTSEAANHTHNSVGGSQAHNHGNAFRPYACLGIVCSKDAPGNDLPAGTKTWLYADSAPSGWTLDSTPSDRLLAVKGGSQAYNANGGTMAGTWTQPDHILTTDEIPAHDHGAAGAHSHSLESGGGAVGAIYGGETSDTVTNGSTGTSGAHTHASVGSDSAHNHGTAYRPLARVGLICSKDSLGNFLSGNSTFFYQNAAPSGWVAESFVDALLGVKGGSVYTAGASEKGTWTQPNCTLSVANLPAHTHGEAGSHSHTRAGLASVRTNSCGGGDAGAADLDVRYIDSSTNGAHTHNSVGGGSPHNHGNTYRPYAAVGIISTKN